MKKIFSLMSGILGLLLLVGMPVQALSVAESLSSSVMFVANDPKEMAFVDLEKLIENTQNSLSADKTISDRDIANFWAAVRDHGAPQAGQTGNRVQVAMVVSPDVPSTSGVLALKGNFDKANVLELMSRRYAEHVNEHISDARQKELTIGKAPTPFMGYSTHRFVMPLRDRELLIVDIGSALLFASHRRGQTGLLTETVQVLTGKTPMSSSVNRTTKIVYAFEPTAGEKVQLLEQLDTAYSNFKAGRMNHRRGVKRFSEVLRTLVSDKKYRSVRDAVAKLDRAMLTIDRAFSTSTNTKAMVMELAFTTEDAAQTVKASVMKHLVAEMKKPYMTNNRLALQNPKVSVHNASVFLQVPMESEEDQLHAFSIMAGYVARSILKTRQTPLVRKVKDVADRHAALGRRLEKELSVEMARTSFFSMGRKFSLMLDSMKVRTDIRRAEDVFVDVTNEPKSLIQNVEKLAEAATRDLNILDKLLEARQKAAGKDRAPTNIMSLEAAEMRKLRTELLANGKALLMTAHSQAFSREVGSMGKGTLEKLKALADKVGPFFYATTPTAGAPAAGTAPSATSPVTQTPAATAGAAPVVVPEGLTLEQATRDYEAAYQTYVASLGSNDETKIREAFATYMAKFQIMHALKERRTATQK
jgi:hypothetical protein